MASVLRQLVRVVIGVALVGVAAPAWAQVDGPIEFTTDFVFVVNGKTFPAGKYEVRPANDQRDVLRIASADGKASTLFDVEPTSGPAPKESDVVFDEYGSRLVLRAFTLEGEHEGAMVVSARRDAEKAATRPTERHVRGHHHHTRTPKT